MPADQREAERRDEALRQQQNTHTWHQQLSEAYRDGYLQAMQDAHKMILASRRDAELKRPILLWENCPQCGCAFSEHMPGGYNQTTSTTPTPQH